MLAVKKTRQLPTFVAGFHLQKCAVPGLVVLAWLVPLLRAHVVRQPAGGSTRGGSRLG